VLYEMIAGRLPFAADYEQAALYGILNEDPEPLTAIRTGVPMELEAVVFKLLRKDRKLRYQTASGLIADLEALRRDGSSVRSAVHSAVRSAPVLEPVPDTRRRLSTWPIVAGVGAARSPRTSRRCRFDCRFVRTSDRWRSSSTRTTGTS
jgi:serine/threonine protein kinase